MLNLSRRSIGALLLALVMAATLASCGSRTEPKEGISEPDKAPTPAGFVFLNPLEAPDGSVFIEKAPRLTAAVEEKQEINSDVVGWLQVPGTDIDDVVLFYPNDKNEYYLRRDITKRYNFNGCYYADYRCTFDGTAEGLSRNTVIYGHNLDTTENQDSVMFGQLLRYRDEEFAKENPYIYFSTEEEDLVWEVFSVMYTTVSLPYNRPDQDSQDFASMISESTKRSLYTYDTTVTASDKILTLSTCTYEYTNSYPNVYRYVIMARLVREDEKLKPEAVFVLNTNRAEP